MTKSYDAKKALQPDYIHEWELVELLKRRQQHDTN